MKTSDFIFKTLGYGIILGGLSLLICYAIYSSELYNGSNYTYSTSQAETTDYKIVESSYNTEQENTQNNSEVIGKELNNSDVARKESKNAKVTRKELNDTKVVHKALNNTTKTKMKPIQQSPNYQSDKIIGVWEVKNDYYMAVYEVEKYQDKYIGKIHYYNDGKTEYTGKNAKEDYFLEGVTYNNGAYKNGKMYMPDGSYYNVTFQLKDNDTLEAKMSIEGSPYTEIWKRSKEY